MLGAYFFRNFRTYHARSLSSFVIIARLDSVRNLYVVDFKIRWRRRCLASLSCCDSSSSSSDEDGLACGMCFRTSKSAQQSSNSSSKIALLMGPSLNFANIFTSRGDTFTVGVSILLTAKHSASPRILLTLIENLPFFLGHLCRLIRRNSPWQLGHSK